MNVNGAVGIGGTAASDFQVLVSYNSATRSGITMTNAATSGTNTALRFIQNAATVGSITTSNTATAYNPSSDGRLKENVRPITNAINTINKLRPRFYDWKSTGEPDDGFIAQELLEIPEFAHRVNPIGKASDGSDLYGVDYMRFVTYLTAAVQELAAKVAELEAKI
jgi:hypothetical protein